MSEALKRGPALLTWAIVTREPADLEPACDREERGGTNTADNTARLRLNGQRPPWPSGSVPDVVLRFVALHFFDKL